LIGLLRLVLEVAGEHNEKPQILPYKLSCDPYPYRLSRFTPQ
jgi:hypothetical protein